MKQRISADDVLQLTPEQQEKLRVWWNEHRQKGDVFICRGNNFLSGKEFAWDGHNKPFNLSIPLLSIGQLLQLLEDSGRFKGFHKSDTDGQYKVYIILDDNQGWNQYIKNDNKLVNALWQAVKEIL